MAIAEVIAGIVLSIVLGIIPILPFVPDDYKLLAQLFEVVLLVGSIVVIQKMESWGISYLLGWLFGTWLMSLAGLVEDWQIGLYAVVGLVTLFTKIVR